MRRTQATLIFALMLMIACVEPYTPAEIKSANDFLVVDGFLNGTSGTANVSITHAIPLSENIAIPTENGAKVTVQSVDGSTFAILTESDKGVYTANNLNFDETSAYRLHIETAGGTSYSSDFIKIRKSPVFDSIVWRSTGKG